MTITKIYYLDEKVRIDYHLKKFEDKKDIYDTRYVSYQELENLSQSPEKPGHGGFWSMGYIYENIYVPQNAHSFCFIFEKIRNSDKKVEEFIFGPYKSNFTDKNSIFLRTCDKCNKPINIKSINNVYIEEIKKNMKDKWFQLDSDLTCFFCKKRKVIRNQKRLNCTRCGKEMNFYEFCLINERFVAKKFKLTKLKEMWERETDKLCYKCFKYHAPSYDNPIV